MLLVAPTGGLPPNNAGGVVLQQAFTTAPNEIAISSYEIVRIQIAAGQHNTGLAAFQAEPCVQIHPLFGSPASKCCHTPR